jgi:hypothetical protein
MPSVVEQGRDSGITGPEKRNKVKEILAAQKTEKKTLPGLTAHQYQRILKLEEVANVSIHVVTDQQRIIICRFICVGL